MRNTRIKACTTTRAGFSLIEIMLALAVIAIGLIAIVGLIPRGVQASREAADNTLAATLVHDAFNGLRQSAMQPPWPPVLADTYYDAAATNQVNTPSADTYFKIHLANAVSTPTLLTVVATVTWPVKRLTAVPPNTNVFVTYIANYQQ